MYVSDLWIYPIKSCRGIAVDHFALDDRGPEHDRRWMLVDQDGVFLSQREFPRLALIDVALDGDQLSVSAPGMNVCPIDARAAEPAVPCIVWYDTVELLHVSREADDWFSRFLGTTCRLMRLPQSTERMVDPDYSRARRLVSLADAFPMLLIGSGSLQLLNEKLVARGEAAIPMLRFRPNIVVAGTEPHEEDDWTAIRVGGVACSVVKPCARCVTTTVDIARGEKGVEPLRTLAMYRKHGSKVLFGQNVIHEGQGLIQRGDAVVVMHRRG